jgi:hypothetical protein
VVLASAAGAGRDHGAADYGMIDAQLVDQGGVAARGAAPAGDLHAGSTSVVPLRRRAPGAAALLDAGWCWPAPPALAAITALLTTARPPVALLLQVICMQVALPSLHVARAGNLLDAARCWPARHVTLLQWWSRSTDVKKPAHRPAFILCYIGMYISCELIGEPRGFDVPKIAASRSCPVPPLAP